MSQKPVYIYAIVCSFLVALLLVTLTPASAKGTAQPDLQAIDQFLQYEVKANRIPGLAVAVVQGDRIIFAHGYGASAPGQAITTQTQFYLGSVSKGFTALAAMQLVEQGKLELDAPVQKYLPWFRVADPVASQAITVRHLLNHTSGLNEKGDPNVGAYTASLEEQVRLLKYVLPYAPTGTKYEYYNQNYRVVGLLIEKVSGQSYASYMQDNVFKPLGMVNSTANPNEAPALAQGYSRVFGFPLAQSQTFIPGALSSGYLITTAEDMGRYMLAQLNNRRPDGTPLLRPDLLALMRTPPAGVASDYGMGWIIAEKGNTLAHGGALEYFQSFVALGQKENIGVVILFNQNSMENMLAQNTAIRDGMLAYLNGNTPQTSSFAGLDWALLTLALADLLNHARLFKMLPHWVEKTAGQSRPWLWSKVLLGMLVPLAVIFGLPVLVHAIEGGAANWSEPLHLIPDLTAWLLVGLSLNLLRSAIHAAMLSPLRLFARNAQ
jgi:CubicO group peptidase (beta-lactamase class C family)